MAKERVNRFSANAKQNGINVADEILSAGKEKDLDDKPTVTSIEDSSPGPRSEENNTPTSSLLQAIEKKTRKTTLSLKLYEKVDKNLDFISYKRRTKVNEIIELILSELYDEKTKKFKLDIPAKERSIDRATSFHLDEKYVLAIKNTASKLNMSSTEYFNTLVDKYIEDNSIVEILKGK